MGYYQIRAKHNTKAGCKDPKYIEIFDRMRDLEYTAAQSKMIASEVCHWLNLYPDWTVEQAIRRVLA